MKRSQIILLSVFLGITALLYIALSSNKKEYDKELKTEDIITYVPVRSVNNKLSKLTLTSYGQIMPNSEVIVSVEVQGKLEKGALTMKPGTNFRKGQILYRVNNEEAFYSLSARKSTLANLVLNALPDIELDFPSERDKWVQFMNDLNPAQRMPELPRLSSTKERLFLTGRNIISEYYNLMSQEARMEKYFYSAPFNGTVISIFAEPGSIANPGGQIAKIAKTGDFEVKVPISMDDLKLYKEKSTAEFMSASGKLVARGKIIRISDVINQQTQSADVYYSIKAEEGEQIYNGMYVNVSLNKEAEKKTMTLPIAAVKEGKVNILKSGKIFQKPVVIVSSIPDSVFVTGLTDGQKVVLEPIEQLDSKIIYKGISR
mgnify:CR=1 FL=1